MDMRKDLEIAVWVKREAASGLDSILVENLQRTICPQRR